MLRFLIVSAVFAWVVYLLRRGPRVPSLPSLGDRIEPITLLPKGSVWRDER